MSDVNIYSGVFWDSKACAVPQYAHVETEAAQQSADQSEKSCEDNLPVSSNISKPNSAPKRCYRIGPAPVAT